MPIPKSIILITCAGLTACTSDFLKPKFPQAQCTRISLLDNGKAVIGVEDMVYDETAQTLYLSAYDRRTHSSGGIYGLPLANAATAAALTVTPILTDIHPHGMDLIRDGSKLTLSFIDRQGDENERNPVIRTISWQDETPNSLTEGQSFTGAELCASNNLVRTPNWDSNEAPIYVTQDHKTCTRKAQSRENIFSPNQASMGWINSEIPVPKNVLTDLSFANGIAFSENLDVIYVAETRKKRVVVKHPHYFNTTPIKLSGGPDNLTRNKDDIYAALIPNLLAYSRFQKKPKKRVKSRFSIITPTFFPRGDKPRENFATFSTVTYDVPAPVISGASVAVKAGEYIWLGSAYDTAIARCTLLESSSL
ncbi:MAG: hypothetical protein ABJG88_10560 [Litorimonas sp.]